MAKTWILDSETKGTGAHMVPLEEALARTREEPDLSLVTLKRTPAPAKEQAPAEAVKFKVVDVMSARVLAEGIGTREVVSLLEEMRSVIDVRVFVWVPSRARWRLLSLDEQKALWHFRGHAASARQ